MPLGYWRFCGRRCLGSASTSGIVDRDEPPEAIREGVNRLWPEGAALRFGSLSSTSQTVDHHGLLAKRYLAGPSIKTWPSPSRRMVVPNPSCSKASSASTPSALVLNVPP